MSSSITILGCGYLGSALASRALAEGWSVSALTRNADSASKLREMGVAQVVEANIEDDSWHQTLSPEQDFVVNCVGAASRDVDGYVTSYVEGQNSAMNWLKAGRVGSYVFTSSCSVYPQTGRKLVDESSSCAGVSERGGLLLAAEQLCFPPPPSIQRSFILRLGGIYGPGRHLMLEKVKNAQLFDGNAGRIINLIHRDDGVKAILACLLSAETNLGRIYNVTDGNHSPRGQIVQWLAGKLSVDSPAFAEDDDENTPNRKVSTNRIMEELEWSPQFSSFIEGYENLLS